MKIFKKSLIITLMLILIALGFYGYYGGLHTVKVDLVETGGEIVIYETMKGDYANSGKIMNRIYKELVENEKLNPTKGIGIYYDNPRKTPTSQLRSDIGEVLEDVDQAKIETLKQKYKIQTLPFGLYAQVEFPFKGFPSVIVGIRKVYPEILKFLEDRGVKSSHPSNEIYDVQNQKIIYRILISQ